MRITSWLIGMWALLVVSSLNAQSNEFKEEFVKLRDTYKNTQNFSCGIRITTYKDYETKEPLTVIAGEYKKEGSKNYSKMDNYEYISNPNYLVVVNNKEKEISYLPRTTYGIAPDPFRLNMDSILSQYDKIYKVDAPAGKEALVLEIEHSIYKKVFLQYDKKIYFIEKVVLYCDYSQKGFDNKNYWSGSSNAEYKNPRVEVFYDTIIINPEYPVNTFSIEKFLIKNASKKYVCTEAYKNYKLR